MRRLILSLAALPLLGLGGFLVLTAPRPVDPDLFAGLTGDPVHGAEVFHAAGCASCHAAKDAKGDQALVLAGGQSFATAFGTFIAPNISPDPKAGIGGWDATTFANAVMAGITREGRHEYPVMPYAAYAHMAPQDLVDLKAYLDTLPPSPRTNPGHDLAFPFNLRLALGGWKVLFLRSDWALAGDLSPQETRGRYLAEALAHCGECHTPRNALGGLDRARWLGGGPMPDGKGRVPNITPGKLDWTGDEIAQYLTEGTTPDFDFAGGAMAEVVTNLSHLPATDIAAIVAYLQKVPALP